MSKKATKRQSSIKDLDNSDSSTEYNNSPGPSTSKAKHVSNEELLVLLENSDFEEDVAESDLSSEDEEEENVCGMYIVEPDALVPPLEMPSQMFTNSSIVIPSSATPATINSPSFTENRSQDQVEWTSTRTNNLSIPFEGNAGLLRPPVSNEPIDFLFHLFTDDLFNLVITETNRQGNILLKQSAKSNSRIKNFKPITRDEFEVFLGLIFLTGHVSVPTISHYWKTNELYNFPIFKNAMSRDRFLLILRSLHFAENLKNGDLRSTDPLYRIRPLFDIFHSRMKEIYYPTKELSLDESMLLWRGRLYFRQYMKNKKHKFGINIYMLTQPDGLVLRSSIYCGSNDPILGGKGHTEKVIKHLLDDFYGMGHSIYMDNFYSSVDMTTYLLEKKTYTTGTLRGNRKGNPLEVINKKLNKGQVTSASTNKGICVLKWHDKRDVVIISSEFGDAMQEYKSRSGKMTKKPEAVQMYNKFMGGVDRSDQLLIYYPFERKTLRWYAYVSYNNE